MSSLDLSPGGRRGEGGPRIRRLNRLPVFLSIGLVVLFFGVIIWGLSIRGLYRHGNAGIEAATGASAANFADQLKEGISDGIIGSPDETARTPIVKTPAPAENTPAPTNPFKPSPAADGPSKKTSALEPEAQWRERLKREEEEQLIRLRHQQAMARIQANGAAYDSPITVDLGKVGQAGQRAAVPVSRPGATRPGIGATDLYAAALRTGTGSLQNDPNGQAAKAGFLNQEVTDAGYLAHAVVPQQSPFELKRGSVIPATLITGINSDLPGRIIAQVRQNVYDSVTGHALLIPQGTKLFGRYDSKVTFGQNRVLVVWTDLIFPNGSTLQLGGMAGTDAEGYGGFHDRVNNHYLRTFGSAVLVALIGTGIDMAIPENSRLANQETASDAARRSFAETFGRMTERTLAKNLNVQTTIEIRPGYEFNVIVEQDINLPGAYQR